MAVKTDPTKENYEALRKAYHFFNKGLFGGELPNCLITMQRGKKGYGYFWADKWANRGKGASDTDEIALNPTFFESRTESQVLSTLVHEMCHLWQYHFGNISRNGYHNKEWAAKMQQVGLMPSNTGEPGGKQTGQRMTHYILPGQPFEQTCGKLQKTGLVLRYIDKNFDPDTAKKKSASKSKFTCPDCGANAWGKPDLEISCTPCSAEMEVQD